MCIKCVRLIKKNRQKRAKNDILGTKKVLIKTKETSDKSRNYKNLKWRTRRGSNSQPSDP